MLPKEFTARVYGDRTQRQRKITIDVDVADVEDIRVGDYLVLVIKEHEKMRRED